MASRVLVALGEERTARLDELAQRIGQSRSAMIRAAVDKLIDSQAEEPDQAKWEEALEKGFGLWARAGIVVDPVQYERQRRADWTRPWDDDYEEVRAESPEMFDEEDDRQRRIYLDMIAGRYPEPKTQES